MPWNPLAAVFLVRKPNHQSEAVADRSSGGEPTVGLQPEAVGPDPRAQRSKPDQDQVDHPLPVGRSPQSQHDRPLPRLDPTRPEPDERRARLLMLDKIAQFGWERCKPA